jgi:hypothetical protein
MDTLPHMSPLRISKKIGAKMAKASPAMNELVTRWVVP